jgi:carbamoyltransferase
MRILGISGFYHDSAAALVVDGDIVAAAQEERFSRKKHDARFPHHAVKYVLEEGKLSLKEIDFVAFYDKPFLKFERLLETYLAFAPRGFTSFRMAIPVWLREKLFQKDLLTKELAKHLPDIDPQEKLLFAEHHQSHAASAFFPSPFEEAVVLTMDGVGEWATTSLSIGKGNDLKLHKEIHFPHSVGLLYSAFTYYTGFKVNSGEYKVMGLAPYGEPKYVQTIFDHLIDLKEDGSFRLDLSYFDYCTGLRMTSEKFHQLFGAPPRKPEDRLTQREMDLAASVQKVTEEIMSRQARAAAKETGLQHLCMAGGVALNCVANGKIRREGTFKDLWIQPAAGDAGGALGAALVAYYLFQGQPRKLNGKLDAMKGSYLGPRIEQSAIEAELTQAGAKFEVMPDEKLLDEVVTALIEEKAIGWFEGRMEYGPRALGARSILGDPRSPKMQSTLNLKVKFRESFRPFAPAVLREKVGEWFDFEGDSPYMLLVDAVKKQRQKAMTEEQQKLFGIEKLNVPRSDIPAVTHVDYSARIQTVHAETNPLFHRLLTKFEQRTGCAVLVNTSFNVRGEPIVCSPTDAFRCFMGTDIEVLVVGNCFMRKEAQDPKLKEAYYQKFELD